MGRGVDVDAGLLCWRFLLFFFVVVVPVCLKVQGHSLDLDAADAAALFAGPRKDREKQRAEVVVVREHDEIALFGRLALSALAPRLPHYGVAVDVRVAVFCQQVEDGAHFFDKIALGKHFADRVGVGEVD